MPASSVPTTTKLTRNSPGDCGLCNGKVNRKFAPGIMCSGGCEVWFHGRCVTPQLTIENMNAARSGQFSWVCERCFRRDGGDFESTQVLSRTVNLGSRVEVMGPDFSTLVARCDDLERENIALRAMLSTLSARVSALEARDLPRLTSSPRVSMGGVSYHWPVGHPNTSQRSDSGSGLARDVAGQHPVGLDDAFVPPIPHGETGGPLPVPGPSSGETGNRVAVPNGGVRPNNPLLAGSGDLNDRLPTVPRYNGFSLRAWLIVCPLSILSIIYQTI